MPLSATTVNYALAVLKFILRDAVDQAHLAANPAAPVRPVRDPDSNGHEPVRFLDPAEIRRLLNAANEPYRTLYEVAVGTGLRRGELLALRWSDVDLAKGVLRVERTRGRVKDGDDYVVRDAPVKTKHSRRTLDLSPALVETLLAHPAGDDPAADHVFRSPATGGPLDPDNVDRAFVRHLALAELPAVRVHDLRHTHASLLVAIGVHPKAIQARMGHASITTTLNTYGHLMPSAFAGVGERLDALLQVGTLERKKEGRPK